MRDGDTRVVTRPRADGDPPATEAPRTRARTRSARLEPLRPAPDEAPPMTVAPDAPGAPVTLASDSIATVGAGAVPLVVRRLRIVVAIAIALRVHLVLVAAAVVFFSRERPVWLAHGGATAFWGLNAASLTASAVMLAVTVVQRDRASRVLAAGTVFLLLQALFTSLSDFVTPWSGPARGIPPATLWLVVAALVPASFRRGAFLAFGVAAMGPAALALAVASGRPVPDVTVAAMYYFPLITAAAVATVVSGVIHRLTAEVRERRRMGSYELTECISTGGMGEVWRARHASLARPAAVKLIRREVLGDAAPERVAALHRDFEREAQTTAALRSPHTVQLYDFGRTADGTLFYVMELLDGIDLERLVRQHGPQPPARVVHILRQICHSLAEAHGLGLVHRDLKPANVLLCVQGGDYDVVKVLDFGLVRQSGRARESLLGDDAPIVGTPGYVAPEVLMGAQDVDARSDLYALGCIAYYLLAGRKVFEAPHAMAMLEAHIRRDAEPPGRFVPGGLERELESLVLALLERRPAARPATASDVDRALRSVPSSQPWTRTDAQRWWETHSVGDANEPDDAPRIAARSEG